MQVGPCSVPAVGRIGGICSVVLHEHTVVYMCVYPCHYMHHCCNGFLMCIDMVCAKRPEARPDQVLTAALQLATLLICATGAVKADVSA